MKSAFHTAGIVVWEHMVQITYGFGFFELHHAHHGYHALVKVVPAEAS
jgi:hypothetical protein